NGRILADHVLIDEAQDLVPSKWQLLRALVAEGPDDLFIADDTHQRIYGQPTVLKRYGIAVQGRSRRLTLNYRTTLENLRYAMEILSGVEYSDAEAEDVTTAGYRSSRSGPKPVTRPSKS
ncbi:UvrD-helicase domain-containing protein, partial [Mycobacterium tuberculosis]|uniref:UvrD-helicase domain-containing protein n=2 Tax=Actinomycetes TaxID=1760 RepID=UPI00186B21DA